MNPSFLYLPYLVYAQFDLPYGTPGYNEGHCMVFKNDSSLPFCNRMAAAPGVTAAELKKGVDYYGDKSFRWWVYEEDQDQIKLLESATSTFSVEFPAMIAQLDQIHERGYELDVEVEELVLTPKNVKEWVS